MVWGSWLDSIFFISSSFALDSSILKLFHSWTSPPPYYEGMEWPFRKIFSKDMQKQGIRALCHRLVNETHATVQASTLANQFTSVIDRAANITNFTENRAGKFLLFSKLKRDLFFNFCVSSISWKHVIRENNIHVCFH